MSLHLQREIEKLKKKVLSLGSFVEESLLNAVRAVDTGDGEQAKSIAELDNKIDQMEVEIEEECLKILALHQPVASDLRFVISVLKINNDLERMGDQAVNIANKARAIGEAGEMPVKIDYPDMFLKVQSMLQKALDSLVYTDAEKAREVMAADDEVDAIKRQIRADVSRALREHPEKAIALVAALGVVRNIERFGDLATNIAEDIIYMIEGNIVRHQENG